MWTTVHLFLTHWVFSFWVPLGICNSLPNTSRQQSFWPNKQRLILTSETSAANLLRGTGSWNMKSKMGRVPWVITVQYLMSETHTPRIDTALLHLWCVSLRGDREGREDKSLRWGNRAKSPDTARKTRHQEDKWFVHTHTSQLHKKTQSIPPPLHLRSTTLYKHSTPGKCFACLSFISDFK